VISLAEEDVVDNSDFNNWADTVEDRIARLKTNTYISMGIGAAGLGVAIFSISLIGKLGKTLGEIAQVTNQMSGVLSGQQPVDTEQAKAEQATAAAAGKAPYVPPATEPYRPDLGLDETRVMPPDAAPSAEPYDPGPMNGPSGDLPPVFKEGSDGLH
jgi:hypothetical protein